MESNVSTPYRKLENSEIRLLRIHPGKWDDTIHCDLEHVRLDDDPKPKYVALSYTWGTSTDTVPIQLGGCEHPITRNLHLLLRRLRWLFSEAPKSTDRKASLFEQLATELLSRAPGSDDGEAMALDQVVAKFLMKGNKYTVGSFTMHCETRIWADALCINQTDQFEKQKQIPRMGDIYGFCERVCVWLEEVEPEEVEPNEDTHTTGDQHILRKFSDWAQEQWLQICSPSKPSETFQLDFSGCPEGLLKQALALLLGGKWYSRAWVIQEAILPREPPVIIKGDILMDFDMLSVILGGILQQTAWIPRGGLGGLLRHMALATGRQEFRNRQDQISSTMAEDQGDQGHPTERAKRVYAAKRLEFALTQANAITEAWKSHDYVYSLLGLCGDVGLPSNLAPNYDKPVARVYQDYAKFLVEHTGSLSLLQRRSASLMDEASNAETDEPSNGQMDVPSWVPDFGQHSVLYEPFEGADPSKISFAGISMVVQGFRLGCVSGIHRADIEPVRNISNFKSTIQGWHNFLYEVAQKRDISHEDAVSDWLAFEQKRSEGAGRQIGLGMKMQRLYYDCTSKASSGSTEKEGLKEADETAMSLLQAFAPMALVSDSGYYGKVVDRLGPLGPKEGDLIVAIHGSVDPLVLRLDESKDVYLWVGSTELLRGRTRLRYAAADFQGKELENFHLV